jgi:ferritin
MFKSTSLAEFYGGVSVLPENMTKALNKQYTNEFQAAHSYMAMASYFSHLGYKGFANFWLVQAEEEREHAMKFYHFLVSSEEQPILGQLEAPNSVFSSPLEVAEKSLEQEKNVTQNIHALVDLAKKNNDHSTLNFLQWFIDEQIEEEELFRDMIKKLEGIEVGGDFFMLLDKECGERK